METGGKHGGSIRHGRPPRSRYRIPSTIRRIGHLRGRPDGGQPKVGAVIDALAELDKELYVIVEQDLYPCAPDLPLRLAVETRKVLAENNLSLL